jgi:hypothetical protein
MKINSSVQYYLKHRNDFTFSGGGVDCEILYKKDGCNWVKGFDMFDSRGIREIETRHPATVSRLIKTKASINFQVKQWAESRADGTLPKILFNEIIKEFDLPKWIIEAVENQKVKFY